MRRTRASRTGQPAVKRAYSAGRLTARKNPLTGGEGMNPLELNGSWCSYRLSRPAKVASWRSYFAEMNAFLRGFGRGSGIRAPDRVLMPTTRSVAAVVTAMNEALTLSVLLRQLNRLPLSEVIVVINGSSDDSLNVARSFGATVVHYPDPLGHDVGRAVGARLSKSEMVLFLDGDIPVKAEQLIPFIYAVHRGVDVALNNIKPYLGPIRNWDSVTLIKEFLNRCLDRPDLSANSLTAVPHALSRRALDTIGTRNLTIPPKAQLIAVQSGLRISAPASVNVISKNKHRQHNVGAQNPVSELIMGDHVEALNLLRQSRGRRMGFADVIRKREAAGGMRP